MLRGAKWVLQHGRIVGATLIVAAAVLLLVALGVADHLPSWPIVWGWLSRWWVAMLSGPLFAGGVTAWIWGRRSKTIVDTAPTGQAEAQERTTSDTLKPHRSNEFWLALAGITATLIVGITGSLFAYKSSDDNIRADATRVTIDQRKTAYVNYLSAEASLWSAARKVSTKYSALAHHFVEDKARVDQWQEWNNYWNAVMKSLPVSYAVRLVASTEVKVMLNQWDNRDNRVQELITEIQDAVDNQHLHTVPDEQLKKLTPEAESWRRPDIERFVCAAKVDLGLPKCSM